MKSRNALPSLVVALFILSVTAHLNAASLTWQSALMQVKRQAVTTPTPAVEGSTPLSANQEAMPGEEASLLKKETDSLCVSGVLHEFRMNPKVKVRTADFPTRFAKDLKLRDVDQLTSAHSFTDNMTKDKPGTVTHLSQNYLAGDKKIPVMGAGCILHSDSESNVVAGNCKLVTDINVNMTQTISEEAALEAAKKAVPAKVYSSGIPKGTQVITFKGKMTAENARMAWQFDIVTQEPSQSYRVEVDAHPSDPNNPEVLNKIDNRMYNIVDWNQNYTGQSRFVSIDGSEGNLVSPCDKDIDDKFRLMCKVNAANGCYASMKMIDARWIKDQLPNPQDTIEDDPDQTHLYEDYVFTDEDQQEPPIFGDESVSGEKDDRVGAALYWGMGNALQYFNSLAGGWLGFDSSGNIPIINYVKKLNSDAAFKVAYYDDETKSISFDPDQTVILDPSTNKWDSKLTLQVCGHEFTHGVIDFSYPTLVNQGEMASLNESFAYIFGYLVYYYKTPDTRPPFGSGWAGIEDINDPGASTLPKTYKGLYYLGNEGCGTSPGCYRTPAGMFNCNQIYTGTDTPAGLAHCNSDFQNSWIQTYMFYLLANGGSGTNDNGTEYSVVGVGSDTASRIAIATMTGWLSPSSTYSEARWAWMAAADYLFKDYPDRDEIVQSVKDAWDAVGVSGEDSDGSFKPVNGDEQVPPWPTSFEWPSQTGASEWEVQVDTSPGFDSEDLQKSQEGEISSAGARSNIPTVPNLSNQLQSGSQVTKTQAGMKASTADVTPRPTAAIMSWQHYLKPNTFYYWRVGTKKKSAAVQKGQATLKQMDDYDWSPSHYFKTGQTTAELISPDETTEAYPWPYTATHGKQEGAEFKWKAVTGATQYCLQPSENSQVVANCPKPLGPMIPMSYGRQTLGNWLLNMEPGYAKHTTGNKLIEWDNIDNANITPKIPITQPIKAEPIVDAYSLKGVLVGPNTSATYPYPLKVDHTYYWNVLPYHDDIEGNWSNSGKGQTFKTSKPKGELSSPINGESKSSWGFPLQGKATEGAVQYLLEVSKSLSWTTNEYTGALLDKPKLDNFVPPEGTEGTLYWRLTPIGLPLSKLAAIAQHSTGEAGDPSNPGTFKVDPSLTQPKLQYPPDGGWVDYKLKAYPSGFPFRWTPVDKAKVYLLSFYHKNTDGSCGTIPFMGVAQNNPTVRDSSGAYVELKVQKFADSPDHNDICWRVQAISPNDVPGELSDSRTIVIGPDRPTNLKPNGNTDVSYPNATISWSSEWAPEGYKVNFFDKDMHFLTSFPVPFSSPSMTSKLIATAAGAQYYWEVEACKGSMCETAARANFTTKSACPSPPIQAACLPITLSNLVKSTDVVVTSATFAWTPVNGASAYQLEVDAGGGSNVVPFYPAISCGSSCTGTLSLQPNSSQWDYDAWVWVKTLNGCEQARPNPETCSQYVTFDSYSYP